MAFSTATVDSREAAARELARGGNRQVYTGAMIAHVWAAQRQQSARSGNGNLFFEGPVFYSYGTHFPLGVIVGETVFLNSDRYSVTTSGHQSAAAYATNHMRQFYLPSLKSISDAIRYAAGSPENAKTYAPRAIGYMTDNPGIDPEAAEALGAVFGIPAAKVRATLAKARKAADKKAAQERKEERTRALREARAVAAFDDSQYLAWESRFLNRDSSYAGGGDAWRLDQDEKAAKGLATRLRRMIKVLRDAKASARHIDKLKARVAETVAWGESRRPAFIAANRTKTARELREYRRLWREAKASGDKPAMVALVDSKWLHGQAGPEIGMRFHRANRAFIAPFESEVRAERAALEKAERERKNRERLEREAEAIRSWLSGGVAIPPRTMPDGTVYVRRRGEELQTSMGAAVPWEHAVKAFRFIKLVRERGEPWKRNGRVIRVGHFQVDEIDAQGNMTAGCHRFAWSEIERLAKAEGVFDVAPSADAVEVTEGAH